MLRIGTKTKLTPKQVIAKAIDFFGPNGVETLDNKSGGYLGKF